MDLIRPLAPTRTLLLSVSLLALVGGCKKEIDPGYKAALQARHDAVCACRREQGAAAVGCYEAAGKEHPEPQPPAGQAVGIYRQGLNDEGQAFVRKTEESTNACATEVAKYVSDYKADVERKAQEQAKEEEAKKLAQQAAKKPQPAKASHNKHGKKKKRKKG